MELRPPTTAATDDLESELLRLLDGHDDVAAWIDASVSRVSSACGTDAAPFQNIDHSLRKLSTMTSRTALETQRDTDRTMARLRRTVPQLQYDLALLRESSSALQLQSRALQQQHGDQNEAGARSSPVVSGPLQELSRLSLLKERMSAVRDVLRDAESWSTLEADVAAYLGEDKVSEASLRLAEAVSSLSVFERTGEYEQRRDLLTNLTDRLQDKVQPLLVEAVERRDLKTCLRIQEILTRVDRASLFEDWWIETRSKTLIETWRATKLAGEETSDDDADHLTLADCLPRFYTQFQTLVNEERIYATTLYASAPPKAYVGRFISAVFRRLEPALSTRLEAMVTHASSGGERAAAVAFDNVVRSWTATEALAVRLQRMLATMVTAPGNQASGGADTHQNTSSSPSVSPQLAVRPMDTVGAGNKNETLPWDAALYEAFMPLQTDVDRLVTPWLQSRWQQEAETWSSLHTSSSGSSKAAVDGEQLQHLGSAALALAEEAWTLSTSFTKGFGTSRLLASVDAFISTVLGSFNARGQQQTYPSQMGAASWVLSSDQAEREKEVRQQARMLRACRTVFHKLLNLENAAAQAVLPTTRYVLDGEEAADQVARAELLRDSTEGCLVLLRASPLYNDALVETLTRFREQISLRASTGAGGASAFAQLQITDKTTVGLVAARGSLLSLVQTTQTTIQKYILEPLIASLLTYASLTIWTSDRVPNNSGTSDGGKGAAHEELQMPSFSLSPSETMAALGEGLLDLPRLFEVFAQDDALGFGLLALPLIQVHTPGTATAVGASGDAAETTTPVVLSSTTQQQPPTPMSARRSSFLPNSTSPTLERRASLHARRYSQPPLPSPNAIVADPGGSPSSPTSARRASVFFGHSVSSFESGAAVTDGTTGNSNVTSADGWTPSTEETLSYWLRSLLLTFVSRLTTESLPSLPRLSSVGRQQLVADLEYLASILNVLNLHPRDAGELHWWTVAANMEQAQGKALAADAGITNTDSETAALRRSLAFAHMARIRAFGRVV